MVLFSSLITPIVASAYTEAYSTSDIVVVVTSSNDDSGDSSVSDVASDTDSGPSISGHAYGRKALKYVLAVLDGERNRIVTVGDLYYPLSRVDGTLENGDDGTYFRQ